MSKRRIRRPKNQEEKYRLLTDPEEFGIFSTYKDIFMAAGTIGFMEQKRTEFSSSAEGIPWSIFTLETDLAIINAIALTETEDIEVLYDDAENYDKKIKIFEEYAAGGFDILFSKVMNNPKTAASSYLEYIMSMENEVNDKDRNLKGIADMLSF